MKKIFISQPMNGRTDEEILRERELAIRRAKKAFGDDIEIIDSFFQGAPADTKPLWYLAKSIEVMAQADGVFFAHGWEEARGCKIEYECATKYGIPCYVCF